MAGQAAGIGGAVGTGAGAAFGGPVGAAIGGSLGGAIGGMLGGTDHSAEDQLKAIQELYSRIQTPGFDFSSLTPQEKAVVGQLTPEAMQAMEMPQAQTTNISGPGRDAQVKALKQMADLSNGGMNLQDKSDLLRINNQASTANKGRQDAILQEMAARGAGGSGQELAAKLASSQNAYNQQADQGTQVAAQARQRALDAMMNAGSMGSNLRSADYGEAKNNNDIINQFNAANFKNKQDISNQNVANRNAAQGFNLQNAQNVSNSNVDTRNAFNQYNQQNQNNLKQQQFGNNYAKVSGQAGMAVPVANAMNQNSAAQKSTQQGIGGALGTLAGYGISKLGSEEEE